MTFFSVRLAAESTRRSVASAAAITASASTIDLIRLVPGPLTPQDRHWEHTSGAWLFDMAMLAAISVFYLGFVRWRIRLKAA